MLFLEKCADMNYLNMAWQIWAYLCGTATMMEITCQYYRWWGKIVENMWIFLLPFITRAYGHYLEVLLASCLSVDLLHLSSLILGFWGVYYLTEHWIMCE